MIVGWSKDLSPAKPQDITKTNIDVFSVGSTQQTSVKFKSQ